MSENDLQKLVNAGRIERVKEDPETARDELTAARRHVEAADHIVELDPTFAFTGAYDAMRKAISAHMRARGYRVNKGPGAHVRTGEYAWAALDELDIGEHLEEFEALRQTRNQSEYDALMVNRDAAAEALSHARAILDAVERDLE